MPAAFVEQPLVDAGRDPLIYEDRGALKLGYEQRCQAAMVRADRYLAQVVAESHTERRIELIGLALLETQKALGAGMLSIRIGTVMVSDRLSGLEGVEARKLA